MDQAIRLHETGGSEHRQSFALADAADAPGALESRKATGAIVLVACGPPPGNSKQESAESYLFGRRQAWFAFAMTIALYVFDYIDRQVIVSLFPHMKQDWSLSDKELGALVSVVSLTIALGALPVALFADRTSRVKSIVVMATIWSLSSISCMFTRSYAQLLAARALIGLGEAGYGAAGAALIASHFPARMRGALMAGFFAAASVGSVLGVMLGGLIAAHWGWKAAFGVVGFPGLLLALLYIKVRDYQTEELTERAMPSARSAAQAIVKTLFRSRTMLWVCVGGAAQVLVLSAVWSWLPSFLNREYSLPSDQAGVKAALVVLCGAIGSVVWGAVVDRAGARRPRVKLHAMALLCIASLVVVAAAFGAPRLGLELSAQGRFALIALGGSVMTCTVGPVTAIILDVTHPALRATSASVLALFLNLFGLAAGSFIAGVLSDAWGLTAALTVMPAFGLLAPLAFSFAARTYEADMQRAGHPTDEPASTPVERATRLPKPPVSAKANDE